MKRVTHKSRQDTILEPDTNLACWDSVFKIKNPILVKAWKDVTCKKCLRRKP